MRIQRFPGGVIPYLDVRQGVGPDQLSEVVTLVLDGQPFYDEERVQTVTASAPITLPGTGVFITAPFANDFLFRVLSVHLTSAALSGVGAGLVFRPALQNPDGQLLPFTVPSQLNNYGNLDLVNEGIPLNLLLRGGDNSRVGYTLIQGSVAPAFTMVAKARIVRLSAVAP